MELISKNGAKHWGGGPITWGGWGGLLEGWGGGAERPEKEVTGTFSVKK